LTALLLQFYLNLGRIKIKILQDRILVFALAALAGFFTPVVFAGVPAGTVIANTVTLTYSVGGIPAIAASNAANVLVGEVINLTLMVQAAAPVAVNSPDLNRVIASVLTNTGNGTETFSLSRNNAQSADQFDPVNAGIGAIFLESGGQPGFQASGPNADILYVPGVNDPVLAADASLVVYVVSDIPAGIAIGGIGKVGISASSLTPGASGAAAGTTLPGLGVGGVDAVVGPSQGNASVVGSYIVSGFTVVVTKNVVLVQDPQGGTLIMPGSVLTYQIVLSVGGSGNANNLAVRDPLPAETTFKPGSIKVNGAVRTDAVDGDNADYTPATRTIAARFGNTPAPANHVVEFQVTVN
jgi:uncharacterized repeat protein (TIGR01451 family)